MSSTDDPANGDCKNKSVIDWSVMEDYLAYRKPGAPDPRRRIIRIYLDSSPALMEAIKTAVNGADGTLITKSGHSLKSCSMQLGAGGLGSLCAELERAGRVGDIEEAKTVVARLETHHAAVTAALEDALQQMEK